MLLSLMKMDCENYLFKRLSLEIGNDKKFYFGGKQGLLRP